MGSNPLNLMLRFVLELCMLGSLGYFGYSLQYTPLRWIAMVGLPLGAATLWGVFAVSDDPSRSGKTVVETPGWARLLLEIVLFGLGVTALLVTAPSWAGATFGALVTLHYALSYDRVQWLLTR